MTYLLGILALLFARAIWDFAKYRAKVMNTLPLFWLIKIVALVAVLGFLSYTILIAIAYDIAVHQ